MCRVDPKKGGSGTRVERNVLRIWHPMMQQDDLQTTGERQTSTKRRLAATALRLSSAGILTLFGCGCASQHVGIDSRTSGQAAGSAFTINLQCLPEDEVVSAWDHLDEAKVEFEAPNEAWSGGAVREEEYGVSNTGEACTNLLETMREGTEHLLSDARYQRAHSHY